MERNVLHVVVDGKEKDKWKAAAAKAGRSLSSWVRWVLNGEAYK